MMRTRSPFRKVRRSKWRKGGGWIIYCDVCGRFYSERTVEKHSVCYRIMCAREAGYPW